MSDVIKFYTNPMSRGRTIHWMLEEVGAKYETELLDFNKKEHKTPAFLAINPMGKLPAIVHKNTVVTETAAICAYLADAFPAAKLVPASGDPARGTFYRWLFFGASCFETAFVDKLLARPAPERPGALAYGTLQDTVATLQAALKNGPFICGDQFTAVDVYLTAAIGWGTKTKALDPNPIFEAYVARCTDRPAYRRSVELGKELNAKLKANSVGR